MADAVSKLYAEIGFKVNQDGLKEAQKLLEGLAKQMSALNNATKEAARQYGIFSKDQNKQSLADAKLALENEKAESQREKRKLDNKKFEHKQLMDLAKLEFQVEKYNASEKEKLERKQAREAEKASKEQQKRLKNILGGFRSFAVGLRNTFLALAGVGAGGIVYGMKQSLDRSVPTRNFLMTTGVSLPDLQDIMSRMVNTGSAMSQQQIMSDIQNVSQNLQDIALGQGELSPYKLLSVAAKRGDVIGVIKGVEQAVKGLDNAMALNLTRRVGLSDDWLASFRYRERFGGNQIQVSTAQQNEIIETENALRQLRFAFKNLSDFLMAAISPAMQKVADNIRNGLQSISQWINDHPNTIKELLDNLASVAKAINLVVGAITIAIKWMVDLIKETKKELEQTWVGRMFRKTAPVSMSKIDPSFEDELKMYGSDIVKDFNTDRRTSSKYQTNVHSDDHSNTTINFNGYNEDQMVEKVEDVIEQKQEQKNSRLSDRYKISDLWAVSPSVGSA